MAKDKRPWRKLVKKLRRSRIRKANALLLPPAEIVIHEQVEAFDVDPCSGKIVDRCRTASQALSSKDKDEGLIASPTTREDEEAALLHKLEEAAWLERERQAQLEFQMKRAVQEKRDGARIAEEVTLFSPSFVSYLKTETLI
jgi:hypothetical protein